MRRRKKSLGSVPARHTHEGRAALSRVFDLSRSAMNYAKAGQCGFAYDELRQLYGTAGEVKAHRAAGGQVDSPSDQVEHAEHVFSDHCTVVSRAKYYKALTKK